jgi:hypothetical protein
MSSGMEIKCIEISLCMFAVGLYSLIEVSQAVLGLLAVDSGICA